MSRKQGKKRQRSPHPPEDRGRPKVRTLCKSISGSTKFSLLFLTAKKELHIPTGQIRLPLHVWNWIFICLDISAIRNCTGFHWIQLRHKGVRPLNHRHTWSLQNEVQLPFAFANVLLTSDLIQSPCLCTCTMLFGRTLQLYCPNWIEYQA